MMNQSVIQKCHIKYINQSKMLGQAICLLLLLALLVFYFLYYRPKKVCQAYAGTFRQLGYKVYLFPFKFLGHSAVSRFKNDLRLHKDCTYTQTHDFPGSEIVIGNVLYLPVIDMISPKLLSHFLSVQKTENMEKVLVVLRIFKSLIPEGLLFSEGDAWKKSKRILSKVFHYDFIADQIPVIVKISNQTFDKFEAISKQNNNFEEGTVKFTVAQLGMGVFSGVVLSSFLGLEASEERIGGVSLQQAAVDMFTDAGKMMMTDLTQLFFGPRFMNLGLTKKHRDYVARKKQIRSIIRGKIKEITQSLDEDKGSENRQPRTIIEAIVAEKKKGEEGYCEQKMIDEVITFIFAGSDTTTNLFTFAVILTYSHPEVLKKAKQEVDAIIKSDSDFSRQNLKKLTYLEAIQHQTLRIYAPVAGNMSRKTKQDCFFGDIPIAKGTIVTTMFRPMLNDPNVFANPREFRPARWLEEAKDLVNLVSFTFSGGPRTCIGKHLALLESKILLAKVIQRYESIQELHERVVDPGIVLNIRNSQVRATKIPII